MNGKQAAIRSLERDQRGSVTAEYAVLLCVVALGCSLAAVGLGSTIVLRFVNQEIWLLIAVP